MYRYARTPRCVTAALVLAAMCGCSAQAKADRRIERADRLFEEKKYREATLEYQSALDAQPDNLRSLKRLGVAHYELRELGQAYRYLNRANQIDPNDLDVRWRLGVIMALSRQPDEARRHADFVLQKDPNNLEALTVVAEAADGPQEVDAAIAQVEEAQRRGREREKASRLLGGLYLKKGDVAKAEAAFQDAVKAAPQSIEAHTALATMHLARRQFALAEKEYKAAADAAPPGSPARLRLADYYLSQKKVDQARQVLADIIRQDPDYVPASLRQAELDVLERKYDQADATLETVLKKNPRNSNALLLRSQVRLVQGKTDEAIQMIQTVIKQEPRFAPAYYQLAMAHLRAGNEQQARASLREAVTLAPGFAEGVLRLAEMNIQADAPDPAIEDLTKLLQARPGLPRAYELLGAAYLKKGDTARAAEAYQKLQQVLPPGDPRTSYYAGMTFRRQGRRAEARKAFQQSLDAAPGAPDPLNQLVAMAWEDKQPEAALDVARKQAQAAPGSAPVQHVLGLVHQRRGELEKAEAAYKRSTELDAAFLPARVELARLFVATNRADQALPEIDRVLQGNGKNSDAWQVAGMAHLAKGNVPKAQDAFKKALEINPRFAPAANNLAWLYSEHGGDAEEALRLAQVAKEAAPDDPYVSDTLGWVLYKRGVYQRALSLLKESAARLPQNASVHFHLGMTHYKLGDKPAARQALSRALELNAGFSGADEARRVLTEL